MSQLARVLSSGDGVEHLQSVLGTDGALAVCQLPPQYGLALSALESHSGAPECLRQEQFPLFQLADGSVRQTYARDSQLPEGVPRCLGAEYQVLRQQFDEGTLQISCNLGSRLNTQNIEDINLFRYSII